MATDNRHIERGCIGTGHLGHELGSTHAVQSSDAEHLLGVEPPLLVQLADRRDHGIDRVNDEAEHRIWCKLSNGLGDSLRDARVYSKQIVPRHARLAWHTGWD